MSTHPNGLTDAITEHLTGNGVTWSLDSDGTVAFTADTEAGELKVEVEIDTEGDVVSVFIVRAGAIPAVRLAPVMELVTRLNVDYTIGTLVLDLDAAVVSARNALDVEGAALTDALVGNLLTAAIYVATDGFPLVDAVVAGQAPADVVD